MSARVLIGPMERSARIPSVVAQHVEEGASLRLLRRVVVRAPASGLHALARLDRRLSARLDGVVAAGGFGRSLAREADAPSDPGAAFVRAVAALEHADLDECLAIARQAEPGSPGERALSSALGWVAPPLLRGLTGAFDAEPGVTARFALVACALHGVDPGPLLERACSDARPTVRIAGLRAAVRCGRTALSDLAVDAALADDAMLAIEGARAATLLGTRGAALERLESLAAQEDLPPDERLVALRLFCRSAAPKAVQALLRRLADRPSQRRMLVAAIGFVGDGHYVAWLVERMRESDLARLAGEAFVSITGVDLAQEGLVAATPSDAVPLVSEDPADARVAVDEDDGLSWPDADRVLAWWHDRRDRVPDGVRLWRGRTPSVEHASRVLADGHQRQRIEAAEWRCLLAPGTPLFNVAAPAWRQQRLLAGMPR